MMRTALIASLLLVLGLVPVALAQDEVGVTSPDSVFRSYVEVGPFAINVPTVVEYQVGSEFIERLHFAVFDKTAGKFEPYYLTQTTSLVPVAFTSTALKANDGDPRTYAEFLLPEHAQGSVQITLTSNSPVTSSALTALLDANVALPNSIEIRAKVGGERQIVLASQRMTRETVRFPKTSSTEWVISFTYGQPLRISELKLQQDDAATASVRSIRFLAQPEHGYRVYLDPDRYVATPVGEAGNLGNAKDVLIVKSRALQTNAEYVIADSDGDSVPDIQDNCVLNANTDQADINTNGRGDVCDDYDQDGRINAIDNCPNEPNRDQIDTDGDEKGDVCDGEESRITEKYTWLPWAGMGFAALVLLVLLALMLKPALTSSSLSAPTPKPSPTPSSREDGDPPRTPGIDPSNQG